MGLWGGRFEGEADPLFRTFNDSLPFDKRLVEEDLRGSSAWAQALCSAGVLSGEEVEQLDSALHEIHESVRTAPDVFASADDEDIHAWVERELIARIGPLGKKLHTGRSRNDQVATDLRLWARARVHERVRELRALQGALLELASREIDTILPGYTHLQRAQPVLFAHWCLAYFEMFDRDARRMHDALARSNECPLGSGALAGSGFPIDRATLADSLDFDRPTANSLDAVSDRDYVLELMAAGVISTLHLTRMAEDLIIYASGEFGFVEMSDAVSSGSSLMPQKKNPDALELIRGKAGRIFGSFTALAMTLKSLPLAYNKDMQEDKVPFFELMDEWSMVLRMTARVLDNLRTRPEVCQRGAQAGYANATEFANYLVEQGMPFREAHDLTGRVVLRALADGLPLEELPLDTLRSYAPQVDADIYPRLQLDAVVARCNVFGGTAPERVRESLGDARARLHAATLDAQAAGIRIRVARVGDASEICRLINYWADRGEMVHRQEPDVVTRIRQFDVAIDRGRIIGCGTLIIHDATWGEIRSIAVEPAHQRRDVGAKLVRQFIRQARELGLKRIFILTRVPAFFATCGFVEMPAAALPEIAWKDRTGCTGPDNCSKIVMEREVTR